MKPERLQTWAAISVSAPVSEISTQQHRDVTDELHVVPIARQILRQQLHTWQSRASHCELDYDLPLAA